MEDQVPHNNPNPPHFIRYPETPLLDRFLDTELKSALWRQQQQDQDLETSASADDEPAEEATATSSPTTSTNDREANQAALSHLLPLMPKIPVYGTIKLHGAHADIVFVRGSTPPTTSTTSTTQTQTIQAPENNTTYTTWIQSRNRILTPASDHASTATFLTPLLPFLLTTLLTTFPTARTLILSGESAGGGLNRSVAISHLPQFFAVFAAKIDGCWIERAQLQGLRFPDPSVNRVYNILDFPVVEDVVDFADVEATTARLTAHTLAVEAECPFALQAGGIPNGTGEGLVWRGVYTHPSNHPSPRAVHFKTKGTRFLAKLAPPKIQASRLPRCTDPGKEGKILGFVEVAVGEERLAQGSEWLWEMGLVERGKEGLGEYMKWIVADIRREEAWRLEGLGLAWEDVTRAVTGRIREWYFRGLEARGGLNGEGH